MDDRFNVLRDSFGRRIRVGDYLMTFWSQEPTFGIVEDASYPTGSLRLYWTAGRRLIGQETIPFNVEFGGFFEVVPPHKLHYYKPMSREDKDRFMEYRRNVLGLNG